MAMALRSIHLKALSCKDLKTPIPFQKPSIYAVASIGNGEDRSPQKKNSPSRQQQQQQQQRTVIDRSGGHNPEWDQEMRFNLDLVGGSGLFLEFDLFSEGFLLLGDKLIGEVCVPLRDLAAAEESSHGGNFRTVSYQVKAADGKPGGVLSFTYRISPPPVTKQQQHQDANGGEFPVVYPDPASKLHTGGYFAPPAAAPLPDPSYYYPPPPPAPDPSYYYPPWPPAQDPSYDYPPPPPAPDPTYYYPPPPPVPVFYCPPPPPPPPGAYGCVSGACGCDCAAYGCHAVGQQQPSDLDAYGGGRALGWAGSWNGR